MNQNHRLEDVLAELGTEPVPQDVHELAQSVMDDFRRSLSARNNDGLIVSRDSAQPPVRPVPDVPTELADGASREARPILRPPDSRHVRRRFVMSGQKTVHWLAERPVKALGGLAACLALFAGVWMLFGGGGAQEAFAAAFAGVQKARTFSCKETFGPGQNGQTLERWVAFKEPDRERSEWLSGVLDVGEVAISDYGRRRRLSLYPATKTASLADISAEYVVKTDSGELKLTELDASLRDRLLALRSRAVEDLGKVDLNGQAVRLLQSRQADRVIKVWVQPQTSLPVQITVERPHAFVTYSAIQLDASLDDGLFSIDPPAGYTLLGGAAHKPAPDDQMQLLAKMRHLLLECHKYANGHDDQFPRELSDLVGNGMTAEALKNVLAAPGQPDAAPILRYRRPPANAPATTTVVLYQAFDGWPEGGIWVGFQDGHCERIGTQEQFEKLIR